MTNSTDQELLPCPFCGGKPTVSNFPGAHNIWCSNQPVKCGNRSMYKFNEWQARAQQPASVEVSEGWRDVIYNTLRNYRMATLDDGEGCGYPLIDAMTADGQTVAGGIEECGYLADALVDALAGAPHPVSGEQKAPSVQITGHLDEVDAPVWEFINSEARKLGPLTGSIDTYNFARPNGSQPNGVVAVLWNGNSIHAMAVTVRDSMNRTQCVRLLAAPPSAQDVAGLVGALMSCAKATSAAEVGLIVDAALAAHRAQQGEQP